ncbi:hypothetical protein HUS74_27095, partial [Pandoraea nosoerga]|nr:hypothetical protein [Pandoraea nosoerga]
MTFNSPEAREMAAKIRFQRTGAESSPEYGDTDSAAGGSDVTFDGPVPETTELTIKLPDAGKRFMSMQVISQDHYTTEVVYGPGTFTYDKNKVGTRYVYVIVRTLANPEDPQDVK